MATDPSGIQRQYRAPCPACGAPVAFRSAQSTHAVCAYCQSTVVRQGEVLQRLGRMAEVFDDHSPLQLMAAGRHVEAGQELHFTLVGRLQYQASTGRWTEWHALLPDGSSATLAEDNGGYVFTRSRAVAGALPQPQDLRVGGSVVVDGRSWTVGFAEQLTLIAAEGELPRMPPLGTPFWVAELRDADGEVLSLEWLPPAAAPAGAAVTADRPLTARGRAVRLEDLLLTGLKAESAKEELARHFSCPHCGAPVAVTLASTRSITCGQCSAVIDIAGGVGGELKHALQNEPVQPLIPLGSTGQLQGVAWQVVGFQHRLGEAPGDDERFGWSEYLLYNAQRGFTFLVDAEDGWSVVKPATGAPMTSNSGEVATYLGTRYQQQVRYTAETSYVAGEFYWPVQRGQKTDNRDYAAGRNILSSERTRTEITWSVGARIEASAVAAAFKLKDKAADFKRDDVAPFSAAPGIGCGTVVLLVIVLLILLIVLSRCSGPGIGSGYGTGGGSYGGYSSGGGHK